jgi:hypothetical protein
MQNLKYGDAGPPLNKITKRHSRNQIVPVLRRRSTDWLRRAGSRTFPSGVYE